MKFHRLIFIFYLASITAAPYKLTDDENEHRLDTCGQAIDITKNQVISHATDGTTYSTATFISPRHILTSADLVLKDNRYWIGSQFYYDNEKCLNKEIAWVQVPEYDLTRLNFGFDMPKNCVDNLCVKPLLKIEHGFIFCNEKWNNGYNPYPMVLVTKTSNKVLWPCLRTNETLVLHKTPLNLHDYSSASNEVLTDVVNIDSFRPGEILTTYIKDRHGKGVLFTAQHPYELIGIGGYDLRTLQEAFCNVFNICQRKGAALPKPKTGKLTEEEDSLRKANCGENQFGVYGAAKYDNMESPVTLISPRHILMSTDLIVTSEQIFMTIYCKKEEKDLVKIALNLLPDLSFNVAGGVSLKPVTGFFICNEDTFKRVGRLSLPMIVEVQGSLDNPSAKCLPGRVPDFRKNQVAEGVYAFYDFRSNGEITESYVKVANDRHPPYIIADDGFGSISMKNTPKGAALVKVDDDEKMRSLIGIYAGEYVSRKFWFFDIQWILEDFCELAGICQPLAPAATTEPSTVPPAPSEAPSTEESSPLVSTTEPSVSEQSTNEPPVLLGSNTSTLANTPEPPEPMEPIKTIDLDEEYKEFKERENNEEEDWDEWGNDFYMSADFFQSSGRRNELSVGFLIVIMVVWRMVLG